MTPRPERNTAFDWHEELPHGVFAIEASAGTGKTYTLASLATRYLAEGRVGAAELLMVTFTRAATGELRSRVRDRLSEAAQHLAAHLSGSAPGDGDAFLEWLASPAAPGGTLGDRFGRLEVALSEFDAATITTIHGFAAQVLGALGVGAGVGESSGSVEEVDARLLEVCSDVLVRASVDPGIDAELPSWETFTRRVRAVASSPDIVVSPAPEDSEAPAETVLLAALVRQACEAMGERRRNSGSQSFDDLLVRLRDALRDGRRGAPAASILRNRFGLALIDEFQDTDPVQWEIFRTLFAPSDESGVGSDTALILVGDPKQAIYSFRGADVSTYTSAVRRTEGRTLETNWRSDAPVIDSAAVLFDGVGFGEEIEFSPVRTAAGHDLQQLRRTDVGDEAMPGLELRCATSTQLCNDDGVISSPAARDAITRDLVSRTIDLLECCALPDDAPGAPAGALRRLQPRDIAVLVRSNDSAQKIQAALEARGVPAVLARGDSVVEGPAAQQLTWLLEALVRPSDHRRARTFASSWFGGMTPHRLACADEAEIGELQQQLVDWGSVLNTRGVVEFQRTVFHDSSVLQRLLAEPDGDRCVTDLEHLGELLRMEVGDGAVSAAGLLASLGDLRQGVKVQLDTDQDTDVTSRRVESDAEAVQIMTVWVAKGLEFPVVLCPNMWTRPNGSVDYHDPDTGRRTFDVESPSRARKRLPREVALAESERASEEMRLLYVALTRARHHTTLWWVNSASAHSTALAKVLFARRRDGTISPELLAAPTLKGRLPSHEGTVEALAPLAARTPGAVTVRDIEVPDDDGRRWVDPSALRDAPALAAAEFNRSGGSALRRARSRWSFSAIVSRDRTHGDPWDPSIEDEGADDEQRPPDVGLTDDGEDGPVGFGRSGPRRPHGSSESPRHVSSQLARLPAGAAFGTLAHDVLENVDFAAGDLTAEVREAVADQRRWRSLSLREVGDGRPPGDPAAEAAGTDLLVEGLVSAIETPLGSMFDRGDGSPTRLADFPRSQRLDEMGFELNLMTGAAVGGAHVPANDRHIGQLLLAHLDADDPFLGWAERLAGGAFGIEMEGHLTGSVDAVLRIRPSTDARAGTHDRYVVVDYKTNRLHDHGVEPVAGDYGAGPMTRSMVEHHYPLQALLYGVALHRYLRWRLDGYDPEVNLGGVAYLFLRGMAGPDTRTLDGTSSGAGAVREGVCTWTPPVAVVCELSDLLAGLHPMLDSEAAPTGGVSNPAAPCFRGVAEETKR